MAAGVDVTVVGSGPNGLAAAVTLARAGLSVRVFEASGTPGGGARTEEATLPGYRHDVCSAVHPQALASPFFAAFGLAERVDFVVPDVSYAQAPAGAEAVLAHRDLERTVDGLGAEGRAWRRTFGPLVHRIAGVNDIATGALLRPPGDPLAAFAFGLRALEQGGPFWRSRLGPRAGALLAGVMAHSGSALPSLGAAGAGLALAAQAHGAGWGIPVGGSQAITEALLQDLRAHGGEVVTDHPVASLRGLPPSRATLLDVSARALAEWPDAGLPAPYRRRLRAFRYGAAVAKLDLAVSEPIPWRDARLADAGTVHLGGTRSEVAAAEAEVRAGRHAEHPFAIVSQPSRFDGSRAPEGGHVVWAYAHVPSGSSLDPTETLLAEIEARAPGFRDTVLASASASAVEVERHNANYVGGDISGGAVTLRQLLARPVFSTDPWRTPVDGLYLCSSSTPPGPAVHGMCGWLAARSTLRHTFGITTMPSLSLV